MSQFIDEAVVSLESGRGGNGAASFHREKHVPRGGPNGADGGRGGDIVLLADRGRRTLYDVRLQRQYRAGDGTDAHLNKRGRDAEDVVIPVPVGTVVFEGDEPDPLVDLAREGMRYVVCRGGRGGAGNLHFTNSIRQAPTFAQKGAPGERVEVRLELKLLADVGLVGLPNAGKSTLISACSAARPKIGDYPFTTLVPNLGVVRVANKTFVMADMPGLIEGASQGHGLGHQFLRHVERTKVLVHVVDAFPVDGSDPRENFETVERELALYSGEIAARPRVVGLNKADLGTPEMLEEVRQTFAGVPFPVFAVSGATGQGLEPMLYELLRLVEEADAEAPATVLAPTVRPKTDDTWDVKQTREGAFLVSGPRVERLVEMTDLSNRDAVRYLHRKLERIGVINRLREMGIEEDDSVRIGDWEFTYVDW